MPVTFQNEEHKRRTLSDLGFNPDQYDVDPISGDVVPLAKIQPTITEPRAESSVPRSQPVQAKPASEQYSGAGTFARHFARSAPANVVGLPAGIAAAGAIHTATAPLYATGGLAWVPPVAAGLGGIAAGVGTALGVDKYVVDPLIKKFAPGFQKQLEESAVEDTLTATLGGAASGLIVGRPSVKNIVSAGRTLGRIGQKSIGAQIPALARAEIENLADVAVGGAIPAGMHAYETAVEGQPFSPGRAAIDIGAGLLLNRLNSLGRKIGRVSAESQMDLDNRTLQTKIGDTLGQANVRGNTIGQEYILREGAEALRESRIAKIREMGRDPEKFDLSDDKIDSDYEKWQASRKEKEEKLNARQAERRAHLADNYTVFTATDEKGQFKYPAKKFVEEVKLFAPEFLDKSGKKIDTSTHKESVIREVVSARAFGEEYKEYQAKKAAQDFVVQQNLIEAGIENRSKVTLPKERVAGEQFKKESNYQLYKNLMKSGDWAGAAKIRDEGFLERYQAENRGETVDKFPAEQVEIVDPARARKPIDKWEGTRSAEGVKGRTVFSEASRIDQRIGEFKQNDRVRLTRSLFNWLRDKIGPVRNVRLSEDNTIVNDAGAPVAGQALLRKGLETALAKINPRMAQADTPIHEILHPFIADLKDSPFASDRRLYEGFKKALENSEEFRVHNERQVREGKQPHDAEEVMTEYSAYEGLNQILNLDSKNTGIKRSWENFISGLKTRWLKSARVEDFERVLVNRFLNDPAFIERYGGEFIKPKVKTTTDTDEERTRYAPTNRSQEEGANFAPENQKESNRPEAVNPAIEQPKPLVSRSQSVRTSEANPQGAEPLAGEKEVGGFRSSEESQLQLKPLDEVLTPKAKAYIAKEATDEIKGLYAWMLPDGRFIHVPDSMYHKEVMQQLIGLNMKQAENYRFIHITGDRKEMEVTGRLTSSQQRKLKDIAIEKGKRLTYWRVNAEENKIEPAVTLYDPENRFSEESQLGLPLGDENQEAPKHPKQQGQIPSERFDQLRQEAGLPAVRRTKEQMQKAFGEVGSEQRGEAESLGTGGKATEKFGGAFRLLQGSLSHQLEHVGDLIHRLSSHDGPREYWPAIFSGGGEEYGRDSALSKVKDALYHFETYVKPNGGLENLAKTVAKSNDNYFRNKGKKYAPKGFKTSFDENWQDARNLLAAYADEHAKLKPASELQKIANEATVALGRLDTETYGKKLQELKEKLESKNWLDSYYKDVNEVQVGDAFEKGKQDLRRYRSDNRYSEKSNLTEIPDYVDVAFFKAEQETPDGLTLEDVFSGHIGPEEATLFKKYPYLRKVYVELRGDNHPALRGEPAKAITLGNGEGTIYLNEKYWDDALNGKDPEGREQLRKAIVHEAAHFVQDKENRLDSYRKNPEPLEKEARDFESRYSEESQLDPTRPLYLVASKVLSSQKELGLNPNSKFPFYQLDATLKRKLPPLEYDLLKEAGLENFLKESKTLTPKELQTWIEENGPRVSVESYGMKGKVSEARREYDKMRHEWYDALTSEQRSAMGFAKTWKKDPSRVPVEYANRLEKLDQAKLNRFLELTAKFEAEPTSVGPRATSAYEGVSAFPISEPMPDWTTSKEAKNVQRVDVVIPTGKVSDKYKKWLDNNGYHDSDERRKEFGEISFNQQIKWQPDGLHENLPNTLGWAMIQYKTGPKGEKIAVIAEAQSRWGQIVAKAEKQRKAIREGHGESMSAEDMLADNAATRHPLLKDYNRIILKAAIDQAKKEGATHIMVSDAETAMITEGHDLTAQTLYRNPETGQIYEHNAGEPINKNRLKELGYTEIIRKPEQEPGMRLNYDKILPSIAEDLLGTKGERVSLGEHKNALEKYNEYDAVEAFTNLERLRRRGDIDDDEYQERYAEIEENQKRQQDKIPRSNLIFKDPNTGKPKTDVSGMLYPIDKAPEKFSLTAKKYSEESKLQGTTPAEIQANFDNRDSNPIFKKENVFRRNIKELPHKLPILATDLDKLAIRGGKSGAYAAPKLREVFAAVDEFEGQSLNPTMDALRPLSLAERHELGRYLLASKRQNKDLATEISNPKILSTYNTIRERLLWKQVDQIDSNQPVDEYVPGKRPGTFKLQKRLPKKNPNYYPEIASGKTLDILLNYPGSEAFNSLKNDFVNHIKNSYKLPTDEAVSLFEDLIASYGGPIPANQTRFGAVRRAEGIGLPDSWIESDPALALDRYWKRTAKDRAYFNTIESDPKMLYILGSDKMAQANPDGTFKDVRVPDISGEGYSRLPANEFLRRTVDILQGQNIQAGPRLDALSRVANNLILGPITGLNDAFAAPFLMAKFAPTAGDAIKAIGAIKNLKEGIKNARGTGRIKERISDYEDIFAPKTEFVTTLRKLADGIATVTGRAKLETLSRGISQAMAEYFIPIHKALAEKGNKTSLKLLEGLANSGDYNKLSDSQLASRLVDLTQGTYDPRGLPSWAIDSQIAPLLRLARWNIEQANNFYKHVLIPAKKGNLLPLLTTLFGAGAGGLILKELREKATGKQLAIPSLEEIASSERGLEGNIPALAYNYMAGLSYIGALGTIGEVGKAGFDFAFKNQPQGYNYPLIEIIGDGITNIARATNALAEGEDPLKVAKTFWEQTLANQVQVGRVASNWFLGDEKTKEEKEARRRLRVFNVVEGRPFASQMAGGAFNPYEGLAAREFKKSDSLPDSARMARDLISDAREETKGEPEEFKKKLSGLKSISLQTFPSPERNPKAFADYVKYLERLMGKERAREEVRKFMKQRNINRVKASFIPSL